MNKHLTFLIRQSRLGIALVVSLTLIAVAVNHLAPNPEHRKQGVISRLDWYLHSDQWQADVHTLVLVLNYVLSPDDGVAILGSPAQQVAAEPAGLQLPRS